MARGVPLRLHAQLCATMDAMHVSLPRLVRVPVIVLSGATPVAARVATAPLPAPSTGRAGVGLSANRGNSSTTNRSLSRHDARLTRRQRVDDQRPVRRQQHARGNDVAVLTAFVYDL